MLKVYKYRNPPAAGSHGHWPHSVSDSCYNTQVHVALVMLFVKASPLAFLF